MAQKSAYFTLCSYGVIIIEMEQKIKIWEASVVTREEQRLYLIRYLIRENQRYSQIKIPIDEKEQKDLLRSLFNVRPPQPIDEEFLAIQNEYLKAEVLERGMVESSDFFASKIHDKVSLWKGDITRLKVGAIVNAANSAMLGCFQPCHSCIDNIIHTYAGVQLRLECNEIMEKQGYAEPTGRAKITSAYNLPCDYVIHTVGPIVSGRLKESDKKLLADSYRSCLEIAAKYQVTSIAFCCISTGVFCFPQQEAAEIAVKTVCNFLKTNKTIDKVVFNIFTEKDESIYQELLEQIDPPC